MIMHSENGKERRGHSLHLVLGQALAGLSICGAVTLAGHYYLPLMTSAAGTSSERIVFALRCQLLPALILFAGIEAVAILRGLELTNGRLAQTARQSLHIHRRCVANTVEQLVLFSLVTMALSTFPMVDMRLISTMTGLFVLGRVLFWIGYIVNPLYRALGMTITAVPTLIGLFYAIWQLLI
jgi:hypothetical protein